MSDHQKSIVVDRPVTTVYNQWTQFEEFPQFMEGVERVTQLDDRRLHWVAEIAGTRREWDAEIVEQEPDRRIAWRSLDGTPNGGIVTFQPEGNGTRVSLDLDVEPQGVVEKIGDKLGFVDKQAEGDLKRFKEFIESRGTETGAWRGRN
ncbi:MAG TPA: SRPBCC family protein [Acidimicrobiales bacterium]|nr:SRPBCC family protein [Acidimicrobiales bacterium]